MAAWTLVPCLVALRDEFNRVSPGRDKGADGSIGDSSHTSSSDHTPDEDSDVLRDHDADSKNEVHALDIDSTGPWPWSFDAKIKALVAREKREYESATMVGRLQNVIWNRRIASRSWGWTWRDYTLADPHTNHAHFSARYLTSTENDTRPWGVAPIEEEPLQLDQDDYDNIRSIVEMGVKAVLNNDATTIANLKARPWQYAGGGLPAHLPAGTSALLYFADMATRVKAIGDTIPGVAAGVAAENAEQVPSAQQVADAVFARLGGQASVQEKIDLLRAALGDDAEEVGRGLAGQG